MTAILPELLESVLRAPFEFAGVVATAPEGLPLILLGGLLVTAPVAVLGYLAGGAAIELFSPSATGPTHRPAGR